MGYVQGMNDVCAMIYLAHEGMRKLGGDNHDLVRVGDQVDDSRDNVKPHRDNDDEIQSSCYEILTRVLGRLQDCYTPNQTGIQRMCYKLENVVRRAAPAAHEKILDLGVCYMQIGFRWFNCLFVREFRIGSVMRVWDAMISEVSQVSSTNATAGTTKSISNASSLSSGGGGAASSSATSVASSVVSGSVSVKKFLTSLAAAMIITMSPEILPCSDFGEAMEVFGRGGREWEERKVDECLAAGYVINNRFDGGDI